jgi:DNA invertase Pin-like site-specific DNA recombinase
MAHLYGYARVSTTLQDPALQTDALTAAGCARIFVDKASGKSDRRPQLDKLLEAVLPGDVIVVWRLDRLGRSLRHLITTLNALAERHVGFRSLTEGFDTTNAGGRLLFNIMGALAEFERDLIVERTQAGLAAARARGRHGGRPTVMTPEKVKLAREMYDAQEYTVDTIAKTIGVSRMTVYRHLERDADNRTSR